MKSSIRVDFKGLDRENESKGFEPVIRVNLEDSEDVRDGLLKVFFESLGGESNWLYVKFDFDGEFGKKIVITPIPPTELKNTAEAIKKRL